MIAMLVVLDDNFCTANGMNDFLNLGVLNVGIWLPLRKLVVIGLLW